MLKVPIPSMRCLSLILALSIAIGFPSAPVRAQQPPAPPPTPPAPSEEPEAAPEGAPEAPETAPPPAPAPEPQRSGATLKGRVLGADRHKPVPGARVHAVRRGGETLSSEPADEKGRYRLDGLPPGTYRLIVSVEEGLFPVEGEIGITSAHDFNLNLAVVPAEGAVSEEVPGVSGIPRGIAYLTQDGGRGAPATFWKSPGGITLLAVSAGAVAYILSRDGGNDEESISVSPSAP